MKTIDDYPFNGKKALVRVDFNVPLDEKGQVTDDTRIVSSIPGLRKILNRGGSVIIMTHLGRPRGKRDDKLSLRHILPVLSKALNQEIKFAADCIGAEAERLAEGLKPGEVLLLENLRFHKEETDGDEDFARQLAKLGDVYVNDAFGTAHRAHASTFHIARFFPSDKMFGCLMETEIQSVDKVLKHTRRPFTAVLGGSKVSTKINIIEALLEKVDNLVIGGGMIYTFVKARGGEIGSSLFEADFVNMALKVIEAAEKNKVNVYLPTDCVAADRFDNNARIDHCQIDKIREGWMGLDIGDKSARQIEEIIENSSSILWNGPMGVFEMSNFGMGTLKTARAVARATEKGAFSLIGGGDTVAAVNEFNLAGKMSYISTAGGALLEYIEGKELPGIQAIKQKI